MMNYMVMILLIAPWTDFSKLSISQSGTATYPSGVGAGDGDSGGASSALHTIINLSVHKTESNNNCAILQTQISDKIF